jgi:signal transduction histidine kinase
MSLRLRLTLTYSLLLVLTLVAFGTVLYLLMGQNLNQELDRRLRIRAQQITSTIWPNTSSLTAFSLKAVRLDFSPLSELASQPLYVQVLDPAGEVLATSGNLSGYNLPVRPEDLEETYAGGEKVSDYQVGDGSVRVFNSLVRGADGRVVGILQVGQSRAGIEDTLETLRLRLFLLGVLAVVITGMAGWMIGHRGLQPLVTISARAKDFADKRNFSGRLNLKGPADEVTRLAMTIDNLLQTVEGTVESHRRFLADTSHELRNPILAVRTNLDLLGRVNSPAERAECISEAMAQIERVSNLVSELLLLARAEAGLVIDHRPTSMKGVLEAVTNEARHTAEQRRIALELQDDAWVSGDPERLHQVFSNLVDNAVRHTAGDGLIVMSLSKRGDYAQVDVRDNGSGIGPEHLPHVFERFYRVDGKHGEGTGLGLSIVKHLVELHGGSVVVESAVDTGTCFTVLLPLLEVRPAGQHADQAEERRSLAPV